MKTMKVHFMCLYFYQVETDENGYFSRKVKMVQARERRKIGSNIRRRQGRLVSRPLTPYNIQVGFIGE